MKVAYQTGPIEALNRKAKDLKRSGRGYRNFDHLRNRFLFSTRIDPALDGREPIHWSDEI
ncbi:MAG: transposase [Firmicutes bacterium]|nr:transposase [Bacillota bacterium]